MNTPRCFSQFSAGSRSSRSLGAHLAILGRAHCAGRLGIPFLCSYLSTPRSPRSPRTLSERGFQPRRDLGLLGAAIIIEPSQRKDRHGLAREPLALHPAVTIHGTEHRAIL